MIFILLASIEFVAFLINVHRVWFDSWLYWPGWFYGLFFLIFLIAGIRKILGWDS